MTHHEKSDDFSRWVSRFCDSVITKSPHFPGCRPPRISKVHFSVSRRHMCTWAARGYPFLSLGASNRLDRVATWEDTFRGQRIDLFGDTVWKRYYERESCTLFCGLAADPSVGDGLRNALGCLILAMLRFCLCH